MSITSPTVLFAARCNTDSLVCIIDVFTYVVVPETIKLPEIERSVPIVCGPTPEVFERKTVLSVAINTVSEPPEPVTVVVIPVPLPSIVNVPPPCCEPDPVLPETVNEVAIVLLEIEVIRPFASTVIVGMLVVLPYAPTFELTVANVNPNSTLAVPLNATLAAVTSPYAPKYCGFCNCVAYVAKFAVLAARLLTEIPAAVIYPTEILPIASRLTMVPEPFAEEALSICDV